MSERTLKTGQIASLLVSTSCGTGFLIGTGELALHQGMAGCLYAIASALGLTVLAVVAPFLWTARQSVWNWFDQRYGTSASRSVALLSMVWMSGVLAAQIRGGSAILAMIGVSRPLAVLLVDALIVTLSIIRLSWLAAAFTICMLGCNAILLTSLIESGGVSVWLHAPVEFLDSVRKIAPVHTESTAISVVLMVIFGADYQQFVLAARTSASARVGCLLAAGVVFTFGFLPAAAVIAGTTVWHLDSLSDPVQAVPVVLANTLSPYTKTSTQALVIFALATPALGSGCAILRAMSDACAKIVRNSAHQPVWSHALPILFSSIVAIRGESLVDTMIDLNMVYLGSVGPLLTLRAFNSHVTEVTANATMAIGFGITTLLYLLRWTGTATIPPSSNLLALLLLSLSVLIISRTQTPTSRDESSL